MDQHPAKLLANGAPARSIQRMLRILLAWFTLLQFVFRRKNRRDNSHGFTSPDKGRVVFDGQDITQLPPNKRQLNTVFQKYALFTHMTIAENIAFGLKIKKKSKSYIDDKIRYALKLVNLDGYENRMPDSLSGGQQQRIAIARAIVN